MIPGTQITNLTVRTMKPADLPQVEEIDRESFALPWSARAFQYELFENDSSLLWVAEIETETGERLVGGVIVIWMILEEAHVATLAVHPAYRGRGIGRKMLADALSGAIRHGAVQATLEVRANNLVAQKLYRRFGFEIVGRRFRYYQDNQEDALIMTVTNLDTGYLDWLENGGWQAGRFHEQTGGEYSESE